MKDYLARYLKEEDEDLKDPGGTALTKLTKPPPEDSFVSFVSAQPLGSPEHGAPQSCPRCGGDLAMSQTKLHRHLWCEGEGCIAYERWEAIGEGGNLSGAFPQVKLLLTLPGVDLAVAQTLLAALGEISRFKARYCRPRASPLITSAPPTTAPPVARSTAATRRSTP